MNILYFGPLTRHSTAFHRAKALERIGNDVLMADPYEKLAPALHHPVWNKVHFRSGYRLLQRKTCAWLSTLLERASRPDLIWVDNGELFGPAALQILRSVGCPILLYTIDDAPGRRDGRRFDSLLAAIDQYDLCVTVRSATEEDLRRQGARKTLRVWMSYDEVAHEPFANPDEIPEELRSEVAFIGTWMRNEGRDAFLVRLKEAGIPVSIWGNRWQKAPAWKALRDCWRGRALGGRDYVGAIQGAKLCLGMLSKGNRDLHTTRSLEVPYAGGLLCAERTVEHLELYEEGKEAVFWKDSDECASVCRELLADDARRESMREAGIKRVRALRKGNESVCRKILTTLCDEA